MFFCNVNIEKTGYVICVQCESSLIIDALFGISLLLSFSVSVSAYKKITPYSIYSSAVFVELA